MGNLTLKSVAKSFGTVEVLKGIDLEVKDGEFVIFVGPSGCGKSTLLRTIAGLEDISSGEIVIDGREVSAVPPAKRGIAMVFQSYALYPHLTVKDNMGLGLKQAGTPKDEIETRVAKASSLLSLEPYLERRPAELSGGQRQRVAIGRAIVREPTLFLFDEPLSNLDAALRVQTRLEIARLHRRLKATMIYVTHDQVEAMTLADKIVVLNAGRIEQVGSPMELYNRPANLFVAGFIGSPQMNFIDAERLGESGYRTLGIRPEHLALSRDTGTWSGKVVHVEHLGADTIVYLESDIIGLLTVRLFGEHAYAPDDVVSASPTGGATHRFGADGNVIR
ncbi:ABC transporter ATP-binding protein [Agrobacterium rosae]|uniref:Sn-glycerol-3-phosphate ABC transporter ATP-binding protein UgpC n=1 Tax=Agrobacterium rosae TaxID=1972867 RepID=A0AAE5VQ24_9HYPH|nr:sn-glycerol-3-phosphate ABC transporter ATP-binding protein UgpC [Agrobacterium rosae]KAA3511440.1 sn-glycerol-3-phosphate ABC transporter ATP-binding protein UgpC [Agrobacterium rosae]KAA3519136.1 sn-glycerol-3-phosphate ABC transporter ATP-binding protein UgpC [Agrobacterium rosae]MCM2436224.1 sn-glycerol-3-phosphate ABC transporter ATP-binding protein UgpC [Agrobacterium rosae]MDX8332243.1 sn-glycerol-3-phosphate ABC transporter ATP-binding protein UgpC [Agrobacterium rosae]MQB49113.1 sn